MFSRGGGLARFIQRAADVREWSTANPDLAAAWDAALDEDEARQRKRSEAARRAALERTIPEFLARCGVGELQLDAFREGLKPTQARQVIADFIASQKLLCLMHGGAGSGKTIAAAESLLARRRSIEHNGEIWLSAGTLARMSYYDESGFARLVSAPWLVIDDLGVEQSSSTFAATLDEVVDTRINSKRRTVLTTNLDLATFSARYAQKGSRFASRLAGYAFVSGAGNEDLRRSV